jgi:hypothetical protein
VAIEGVSPAIGQADTDAAPAVRQGTFDHDVTGVLQGGELLGQRRVGQCQPITDEREVDPVGGGQQGDDG